MIDEDIPFFDGIQFLETKYLYLARTRTLEIMRDLVGGVPYPEQKFVTPWKGYELALLKYQYALCEEWHVVRGLNDEDILKETCELFWECLFIDPDQSDPPWFDIPTKPFAKKTVTHMTDTT